MNLDSLGIDAALPVKFADHCLKGNVHVQYCKQKCNLLAQPVLLRLLTYKMDGHFANVFVTGLSSITEFDCLGCDPSTFLTAD